MTWFYRKKRHKLLPAIFSTLNITCLVFATFKRTACHLNHIAKSPENMLAVDLQVIIYIHATDYLQPINIFHIAINLILFLAQPATSAIWLSSFYVQWHVDYLIHKQSSNKKTLLPASLHGPWNVAALLEAHVWTSNLDAQYMCHFKPKN